ncbi:hypothetical protein EST38_g1816 [Candolleomyces aberdarensis]|uniref:Uncharacterized protein n=1 Tax=Candolleomyces aberdarensis TaxID=2316362 RepID=A0A4Q2DX82_9AGAR|nr:hypothetical protein EST38_g1816 [Candolleomyces aberdarensis]
MILNQDTPNLPPLPEFQGADEQDLTLEVFTHKSLNPNPDELKPGFGNADRLSVLGSQALSFAVTQFYFRYTPQLTAQEIILKANEVIQGPKIIEWLDAYPLLKTRLRRSQASNTDNIFASLAEASTHFHTYVGALQYSRGPQVVNAWIFGLLSLSEGVKVEDEDIPMQDPNPPPPASSSSASPPPPGYPQGPPPGPPPGYPASNAPPAGSPSIPTNFISLSFVHETATKRRVSIDYSAHKEGAAHTPSWTVCCIMDGVERGRGTSSKQKTAKEEAARNAFVAMGWA